MLLGIFAVSATVMVLLGVRFYRSQTERSADTAQHRILTSYVRSMVRSMDAGQIGVEFEIPSVPLNLSLDWRPVYYFNYGGFGWQGIALGIRYRF